MSSACYLARKSGTCAQAPGGPSSLCLEAPTVGLPVPILGRAAHPEPRGRKTVDVQRHQPHSDLLLAAPRPVACSRRGVAPVGPVLPAPRGRTTSVGYSARRQHPVVRLRFARLVAPGAGGLAPQQADRGVAPRLDGESEVLGRPPAPEDLWLRVPVNKDDELVQNVKNPPQLESRAGLRGTIDE